MFEHSFTLQDWITELKFLLQIWHGLQSITFRNTIIPIKGIVRKYVWVYKFLQVQRYFKMNV